MSTEWVNEYIPGNVRMSCSICGLPYRFPDELAKGTDGLFRCLRTCVEQPIRDRDRVIAQSHKRKEVPPPKFGMRPPWETSTLTTVACTGGAVVSSIDAAHHGSIKVPLFFFDESYIGHKVTLANTNDSFNDGPHTVLGILDRHTVKVPSGLDDQVLTVDMTMSISP